MDTIVTAANAVELADWINAAFEEGIITTVNGEALVRRFTTPVARAWLNGTVSVTVQGRGRGKINDLYIKVGKPLRAH